MESHNTQRSISKQNHWRKHISSWSKSGLTQRQYCLEQGIAISTFSYWIRKIGKGPETPGPTRFYPLTVQEVSSSVDEKGLQAGIRLSLCHDKFKIELDKDFSSTTLKETYRHPGRDLMLSIKHDIRVYIAIGITDMRKSINGLSLLVQEEFELDLFSGSLFAFCNRRQDIVKILYWSENGFCLWMKRLEKQTFRWPESEEDVLEVNQAALGWLLQGLDLNQAHRRLDYSSTG